MFNQHQKNPTPFKKILLLGSGGLTIGQAGEFDYSGEQCALALESRGIEVLIFNPNIATVQTTHNVHSNRKIFLHPLKVEWVEKVIKSERPCAIIGGFGGQSALNLIIELSDLGLLEKYQVKNLGTPVEVLKITEDRDLFREKMIENQIPVLPSIAVATVEEALLAAHKIQYPVMLRAAYALGGLGSGFCENDTDLIELASAALNKSPQVLIEKSLKGFREVEYEVMRDQYSNKITICNMENIDPLGVHTGESIVVAPSQTLTDQDYQKLRSISLRVVECLGIVGECNVQFALAKDSRQLKIDSNQDEFSEFEEGQISHDFYVIEVNARLSRSSALASKATGYPIAFIAAQVVLGISLLEIPNPLIPTNKAFFEPALDYVVVKFPKWDLEKFPFVSTTLSTTMKSIGEVMSIGKNFPEALLGAMKGVWPLNWNEKLKNIDNWDITTPSVDRMFFIFEYLLRGKVSVSELCQKTSIHPWFIEQIQRVSDALIKLKIDFNWDKVKVCKELGLSDEYLVNFLNEHLDFNLTAQKFREERILQNIKPVVKMIDTTSGEFLPSINCRYLYMSYGGGSLFHDVDFSKTKSENKENNQKIKKVLVVGGGSYSIGSSVEFDWCLVQTLKTLKENLVETIMVNCNPETVSTDFNFSDHLYFEELSAERIMDILDLEKPQGIILSMGGQVPQNLIQPLKDYLIKNNIKLLGHNFQNVLTCESRQLFSNVLDQLDIPQAPWIQLYDRSDINLIDESLLGPGPFIARPSFVLSGTGMQVIENVNELNLFQDEQFPVTLSTFFRGAREWEVDGVSSQGKIVAAAISEHIEEAGVHSGDSTLVYPTFSGSEKIEESIKKITTKLIKHLNLNGPFNLQFLSVNNNLVYVIECNLRASRSFPFISKTAKVNFVELSVKSFLGELNLNFETDHDKFVRPKNLYCVKSPMFSFHRLKNGAQQYPLLGVQMRSTGEVAAQHENLSVAFLESFQGAGNKLPTGGKGIFLELKNFENHKEKLISIIRFLGEKNITTYVLESELSLLPTDLNEKESLVKVIQSGEHLQQLLKTKSIHFIFSSLQEHQEISFQYGATLVTEFALMDFLMKSLLHKRAA
jgi:carbamoyl-phosphate synthase large subunit